MNMEEIKVIIKDGVYSEDGIIYMSDKQYNNYIDIIEQLQKENQSLKKENKILRENAEHNDKVVDKINWENLKLKKQLEEYKRLGFKHLNDKCNKLENQQKQFIEWLTNEANINPYDISDYIYENIINTILSKYNGIIGSDSK